jgi:hypothetical protein
MLMTLEVIPPHLENDLNAYGKATNDEDKYRYNPTQDRADLLRYC